MRNTCGIYKITNLLTGHYYIGSSINIATRWVDHRCAAKKHTGNSRLYSALRKYGIENFDISVLEECSPDDRLSTEQKWLDMHFGNEMCYNISKFVTSSPNAIRGAYTEERKRNISKAKMGIPQSPEARKSMSDAWKRGILDGTRHSPTKGKIFTQDEKLTRSVSLRKWKYDKVINPAGEIFDILPSLNNFCKSHELLLASMSRVLQGKALHHKGWRAAE